jgi:hypothetical protein
MLKPLHLKNHYSSAIDVLLYTSNQYDVAHGCITATPQTRSCLHVARATLELAADAMGLTASPTVMHGASAATAWSTCPKAAKRTLNFEDTPLYIEFLSHLIYPFEYIKQ